MNNVAIEGISDLNVVTNLFSRVGCVGAINESIKEQVGEFHKNLDYKKDRM